MWSYVVGCGISGFCLFTRRVCLVPDEGYHVANIY